MSTFLPSSREDLEWVAENVMKSGVYADIKDASQALYKIMYGGELGIPPIASMNGVYFQVSNKKSYDQKTKQEVWTEVLKPAMTSAMMACLIKKSGRYNYKVREFSASKSAIEIFEHGESLGVREFTIKDAQDAELTTGKNGANYKKYARNMLHARNISNIAKIDCADVFGGMPVYIPEELDMLVDPETGEPISEGKEEAPKQKGSSTTAKGATNVVPIVKEQDAEPAKVDEKKSVKDAEKPKDKAVSTDSAQAATGSTSQEKATPTTGNTKEGQQAAPGPVSDEEFKALKGGVWEAAKSVGYDIEGFKAVALKEFDVNCDVPADIRAKLDSSLAGQMVDWFTNNPKVES
jgi:hypothetical protein